ncbi:hypothetical protein POVWA2_013810 [Plasmodium ovale wallikeri]|uniref:Uncharacterized protein n=1 Tax=Plasmodium ovale wallikeri TaxID=864142 RepID=A0A1A8YP26_PLAOA|nr:hypothetical protein POVWA1_013930 [Plasmodium ovale wallikeri]SBT33264.1 hypothetical protein POVWA2_013810 [Plasmodium ovale wallikeri]
MSSNRGVTHNIAVVEFWLKFTLRVSPKGKNLCSGIYYSLEKVPTLPISILVHVCHMYVCPFLHVKKPPYIAVGEGVYCRGQK